MTDSRRSPIVSAGVVILLALAAIVLLLRFQQSGIGDGESHVAVGSSLPALQLQPLVNTSDSIDLDAVAGKVALINYWGPWCRPCQDEMPHIMELQRELQDNNDFQLVSVSCGIRMFYRDFDELRAATFEFARNSGIDFPIHADMDEASRSALSRVAQIGTFGFPTSVLLDRDGVIRAVWEGYSPKICREIKSVVRDALRE